MTKTDLQWHLVENIVETQLQEMILTLNLQT